MRTALTSASLFFILLLFVAPLYAEQTAEGDVDESPASEPAKEASANPPTPEEGAPSAVKPEEAKAESGTGETEKKEKETAEDANADDPADNASRETKVSKDSELQRGSSEKKEQPPRSSTTPQPTPGESRLPMPHLGPIPSPFRAPEGRNTERVRTDRGRSR